MRQQLRKLLPYGFKLQWKLLRRYINESKTQYSYPKYYSSENIGEYKTELRQIIRKGEFYENKLHNLKIVGEKINHLIIYPNEVFFFLETDRKTE